MLPDYLFQKQVWFNLQKKIFNSKKVFLLLDYDGTVIPIKKYPSLAILSEKTKYLISNLTNHPNIFVGIVTGRSLKDIMSIIGIKNLCFAANHGFEIYYKKQKWIHPDAKNIAPKLKQILADLNRELKAVEGTYIENKGLSISVHYRNVKPKYVPFIKRTLKNVTSLHDSSLKLTSGKKVFEIRPNIEWNKGQAIIKILKLQRAMGKSIIIFIGDDKTDEDAFRLLPSGSITVRVGRNKSTHARYYVRSFLEVHQFLKEIIFVRKKGRQKNDWQS